jgi:hypothetical protein
MLLEHDLLRLFAAVVEQLQKLGLIPTLRRLWMDMSSDKNSKSSSASPAELWGHMIHQHARAPERSINFSRRRSVWCGGGATCPRRGGGCARTLPLVGLEGDPWLRDALRSAGGGARGAWSLRHAAELRCVGRSSEQAVRPSSEM